MRTKNLLTKMLLLIAVMLMGAGTAWATTVKYGVNDKTSLNISGTVPTGSSALYSQTYGTVSQMTAGNSQTLTLSGYNGYKVTNITLSMKSNTSKGAGKLSYSTDGGSTFTYLVGSDSSGKDFNTSDWYGSWSTTYVDVSKNVEIEPTTSNFIIKIEATANSLYCRSYTLTYEEASSTPTCATPTFTPAAGTYTSAQNVTISTTTEGATIYYTTDGTAPSTNSSVYSAPINVSETTTIKAIAVKADYNNSAVASASYTIVNIEHAGTEADPYTVADARTAIDANTGLTEVFATGIVSSIITAYNSSYGNITFDISTDGLTTSAQLRAYRCKGTTDADASEVQVGDVVVIMGNLTKYGDTYEFAQDCQLISIQHPVVPTIVASPSSLSDFTYEESNGPSAIKTISVSGSNLTSNISLSLGESSNFEMSLSEGSDYTNSLTLTPEEGVVSATTIYVRLKAGLDVESYSGTITLASTDANNVTVSLSGSVTEPEAPNVTWDLSTDQTATATEDEMSWTSSYATMTVDKGSSTTNVNNYYPGTSGKTYTSTRFYKNSLLTITPATGFAITSVEFTATSEGYASTLKSSDWTNAIAEVSGTTVTVTPIVGTEAISATIGGTCGFTMVKVYYEVPAASAPVWSALPTPTLNVGEDYELNLTQYVSGNPTPTISVVAEAGDYFVFEADEDNYFYCEPSVEGEFKYIFTATNSVGSADAILTITVVKPDATIVVDKNIVEATAAETNGTIEVTYSYTSTETEPEIVWYTDETATTTTDEPSWISADFDEDNNIDYLIDANDGAARTAYMKVYAFDDEANDVYSELITITQAAYVAPVPATTYTLATAIVPGKHYIITNGSGAAMGVQNTNNRAAVDITINEGIASVESDAGVYEFVICGPDADGNYAIYDETAITAGYLYAASSSKNYLRTQTSYNQDSQWTITIDEKTSIASIVATNSSNNKVMQYNSNNSLFSCYASASQSPVFLYEKDGEEANLEAVNITAAGYATYCSENALEFTGSGLTAYIAKVSNENVVSFDPVTCVPANTGVLLKGEAGEKNINVVASSPAVSNNAFVGVIEQETIDTDPNNGIFVLMNGSKGVGFYKTTGSTFTLGAHTAYLPAMEGGAEGNARSFIGFDFDGGTTTAIAQVDDGGLKMEDSVYNLQGQRVVKAQKGLYIVNGRLQVVK